MKHIFFLIIVFFLFGGNLKAQSLRQINSLYTENGKYYLLEDGRKNLVNSKVITLKIKKGKENAKKELNVLRENKLGYLDILVPDSITLEDYAILLDKSGYFDYIKYNTYGELCATPNDVLLPQQWYLDSINVFNAWDYTMGSPSVKVAVIDCIPPFSHYDIYSSSASYNNIDWSLGHDYTLASPSNSHGESVAGIISAKTNNILGIAGISGGNNSAGACIIPLNVATVDGKVDNSAVDDAIRDATDAGARIINLSIGYFPSRGNTDDIAAAIEYAKNHNVLLVASAGNDSLDMICFPASHPDVIAVGSVGQSQNRSLFSNASESLELVAPGENIFTIGHGGFVNLNGTSSSTSIVSGVAALILSANPNLSAGQVRSILCNTARDLGSPGRDAVFGYGLVDAYAAVNAALAARITQINGSTVPGSPSTYSVQNLPSGWSVVWSMQGKTTLPSYCTINYPAANQLQVNNSSKLHIQETLVAKVYNANGTLVKTLTKYINTADGFTGTYSQTIPLPNQSISGPLFDGCLLDVQQGYNVLLTSTDFNGATVTYASFDSPTISTSGNTITFRFRNSTDFSFCQLHIVKGDKVIEFSLRAEAAIHLDPDPPIITGISGGDNSINISLSENVDSGQPMRGNAFDSWELTIYSYTTGKVVHRQKVSGRSVSIDTSAWEPDTYIVRIWIDDKEIVKKFVLE